MDNTENAKISKIIQTAANQITKETEEFFKTAKEAPPCGETVSVMFNGREMLIDKEIYDSLKNKNKEVKTQMKADLKAAIGDMKNNIKSKQ